MRHVSATPGTKHTVTPAKAGVQFVAILDSGFRRNDGSGLASTPNNKTMYAR